MSNKTPPPRPTVASVERLLPFATPIFRLRLPGFEAWNGALRATILRRRDAEPGVQRSNQAGGWHSTTDAHQWDEAPMQALCTAALRALTQVLEQQYPAAGGIEAQLGMCWANVNSNGAWNLPHQHSGYPWVGAYYVDVGTEGLHLGQIGFINPLPMADQFWQPQQHHIEPRAGELLLFPGGMLHYVHPNANPVPRVSVAFNFRVRTQQPPWS